MSFDLAVWFEATLSLTPEAAEKKYIRLCDEDLADVVPSERVSAFYGALTAMHPEIGTVPDEDLDACPWTAPMDVSPGHVIMPITGARAEEIGSAVRTLARQHGLVCFDPQAGVVHTPDAGSPRQLHWQCCDGTTLARPEVASIERELDRLSERNWYAVLEDEDARYVQVGLGRNAGVSGGGFAVEYRDGTPDRHFRHMTASLDIVKSVFLGFTGNDNDWYDRLAWQRVQF
ncbi:hypothetical protein OG943_25355 [Amycolatopsis sp. NBC_00345]|uniref:hypothetical protein n=1 Tax=Amycolatopsis sp. NBC_00345 TaxID=2975955 RepID=UPI002E25C837